MGKWETRALGEICEFRHGNTPSKADSRNWGGSYPWVSPKDMRSEIILDTEDHLSAKAAGERAAIAKKDTLLVVVRSGILAHTIPVAIAGRDLAFNQDLKSLRVTSEAIIPRYIFRFLQASSPQILISGIKKGATVHSFRSGFLESLPMPVPPLAEQERIVTLLDEAHALRKRRAEAGRRTADLIPALFHEMLGNSGGASWVQSSFADTSIVEIIDGDRGKSYPKKTDFRDKGFCLFLNTSNVRKGAFDFSKCDFISQEKDRELRKGKLSRDDVVLTTRGTLGNSAHYNAGIEHANMRINSGMVILRANPMVLLPEYLLTILNSDAFISQVSTTTSGSAQPQLPINRLGQIRFVLPPLSLQGDFVARVTEIRTLEAEQAKSRSRLDDLFQSMLHRAFSGEL